MRSIRRSLVQVLALAVLAAAGCGTYVSVTPLGQPLEGYRARPPRTVKVYASGAPAAPHTDLAIIEAEQTHGLNEQSTGLMIRRMRQQAAAMGCDGIVLGGVTQHDGGEPGTVSNLLDPGSTKREATCIVFEDPPTGEFSRSRNGARPSRGNGLQAEDDEDPR